MIADETIVYCDGHRCTERTECGAIYSHAEARQLIRANGFVTQNGMDYCQYCARKLSATAEPRRTAQKGEAMKTRSGCACAVVVNGETRLPVLRNEDCAAHKRDPIRKVRMNGKPYFTMKRGEWEAMSPKGQAAIVEMVKAAAKMVAERKSKPKPRRTARKGRR